MARVLVVGAGLAGLSAAIHAAANGHHVVVLERSSKIGGRGTSQIKENFSLSYGPHLFLKKGPLWNICRRLSRRKFASVAVRIDKVEVVGHGLVRPKGNISKVADNRRAIKINDQTNPIVQGVNFLSNWGGDPSSKRLHGLMKSKLMVSNEGWIGLVGRLAAALDEIGVLIECGKEVRSIDNGSVELGDGKKVKTDVIILACGLAKSRQLLSQYDENKADEIFHNTSRVTASIIEAGLDSQSLRGKQIIVDPSNQSAIIDYIGIQSRLSASGAHLSAITVGGLEGESGVTRFESSADRLQHLEKFLDSQASGWRKHIITELKQEKITLHEGGESRIDGLAFAKFGFLMAGSWVESEHVLSDGAVFSGKIAGQNIAKAHH